MDQTTQMTWPLYGFDDIIDGYFPLHISLLQMMQRMDAQCAVVHLAQVPIMHIPDLPNDAPVPLNIRAGTAGLIDRMILLVTQTGSAVHLRGVGDWQWFDGKAGQPCLDPMTRLAEPAYVIGWLDRRPRNTRDVAPDILQDRPALLERLSDMGWPDQAVLDAALNAASDQSCIRRGSAF